MQKASVYNKEINVSENNYTISGVITGFGDPRDYAQLSTVFKLYDKEGKEGALTGTYVPSQKSTAETLVRREDSVYFEHLKSKVSKVVTPEGFHFPYDFSR